MARQNEMAGRTGQAWRARYASRAATAAARVAHLREIGIDAALVPITPHGPGIPGGITYLGGIEIDGRLVTRREVRQLLKS